MCHVRMESSTGLVTETNGVLDLAKVNIQKKTKKNNDRVFQLLTYDDRLYSLYLDLTW